MQGIGARVETGRYSKGGLMWGREVSVGNGGEMEESRYSRCRGCEVQGTGAGMEAGRYSKVWADGVLRGTGDWVRDGSRQVLQM